MGVMTLPTGADIADIRRRGRETQALVFIVLALAATSIVGDVVAGPLIRLFQGTAAAPQLLGGIRDNVIEALPIIILLSGLWSAQRVFGRVADGEVFTAANAAGVGEIGSAMGWCGFAEVVMVPTIKAWVAHTGGLDFALEGWAIVLSALGGAVVLFGRIWALAVEIKADADQII